MNVIVWYEEISPTDTTGAYPEKKYFHVSHVKTIKTSKHVEDILRANKVASPDIISPSPGNYELNGLSVKCKLRAC